MKKFIEWMEDQGKKGKLIAMRRWMWNKEHGSEEQKKAPPPISSGDPDFELIIRQANRLGPLDPLKVNF